MSAVTKRNISALKGMKQFAVRSLEQRQLRHPDHRFLSVDAKPFPCPVNAVIKAASDIDFRATKPKDLPEGMNAPRKRATPATYTPRTNLGKSKWDFQYMESGNSIAIPVQVSESNDFQFRREVARIKGCGRGVLRYQKNRGYVDPGFLIQTSVEDIVIKTLPNGDPVTKPHVVFWRIDGTPIDPAYLAGSI
jgi:hypothetical protein